MKRAALLVLTLAVATLAAAQQPAKSNPPATQPAATTPGVKAPPQAKTKAEYEDYMAAVAKQADPAALEGPANDFAAKFPTSDLRGLLFRTVMRGYQSKGNGDKMQEAAQKLLKIDPDDPEALVNTAQVITEHTHDTDLDKDQRYDEARKDAQRAIQTVETDVPAGVAPNQVDTYKGLLKSSAYSILGTIDFNQEKFVDAEGNFRKSIDAYASQPDPVVVLRLALALDKQGKYPDALKEANRAVEMTTDNPSALALAKQERDRLVQLTGGSAPAPAAGTPANPAPAPNAPH